MVEAFNGARVADVTDRGVSGVASEADRRLITPEFRPFQRELLESLLSSGVLNLGAGFLEIEDDSDPNKVVSLMDPRTAIEVDMDMLRSDPIARKKAADVLAKVIVQLPKQPQLLVDANPSISPTVITLSDSLGIGIISPIPGLYDMIRDDDPPDMKGKHWDKRGQRAVIITDFLRGGFEISQVWEKLRAWGIEADDAIAMFEAPNGGREYLDEEYGINVKNVFSVDGVLSYFHKVGTLVDAEVEIKRVDESAINEYIREERGYVIK